MTIRDHGLPPDIGGLGPKIKKAKPAPKPVEVAPGVYRDPDGKLRTEIPPPAPVIQPGLPALPNGYRYDPYPFVVIDQGDAA